VAAHNPRAESPEQEITMPQTATRRPFAILFTALTDAVVRANSNNKSFVKVRGTLKSEAERTVMTYVPKVVEQIGGLKAGETVRLLGDFRRDNGALTFSATAVLPLESSKKAEPVQQPAGEVSAPVETEAAPEMIAQSGSEAPVLETSAPVVAEGKDQAPSAPPAAEPKAPRKRASRGERAKADAEKAASGQIEGELPLAA
jgi:hypothetical protein